MWHGQDFIYLPLSFLELSFQIKLIDTCVHRQKKTFTAEIPLQQNNRHMTVKYQRLNETGKRI